ncbi:MAG TPA: MBL fold metallo-hydrolase [Usitatibacter sp.]|nr:MBL fold metallo-hydrolase [Usitatibacter sp.]
MNAVTILHDSFGADRRLEKNWGFAALVEHEGRRILFDTGNDEAVFGRNVESLGIDLASLDFAVISHRHGDHTSGLAYLFSKAPRLPVWVPKETYGVFGSTLPGTFYPRCPTLPLEMRYYDGFPPELIRHGTPWRDADFRHVESTTEIAPGVTALHTVSTVPGTMEMPELTLSLRTGSGQVIVAGCSHPGIEKILAGAGTDGTRVDCIFGGLHWVLTPEPEIERLAGALKSRWNVRRVAPGHCTGEPGFRALQQLYGEDYIHAGLGTRIAL